MNETDSIVPPATAGMESCELLPSAYLVHCILPHDRTMRIVNYDSLQEASSLEEDLTSDMTFDFHDTRGERRMLSCDELQSRFSFTYTRRLYFLHEKELRDSIYLLNGDDSHENSWLLQLNAGLCSSLLSIRFVNEAIGFGLFAREDLEAGVFVGEYTGIVRSNSKHYSQASCAYACSYSSDGGMEVNAFEWGNLLRFVNHALEPNCEFRPVTHRNLRHIIVVTTCKIAKDAQLLLHYGDSYWRARGERRSPS